MASNGTGVDAVPYDTIVNFLDGNSSKESVTSADGTGVEVGTSRHSYCLQLDYFTNRNGYCTTSTEGPKVCADPKLLGRRKKGLKTA